LCKAKYQTVYENLQAGLVGIMFSTCPFVYRLRSSKVTGGEVEYRFRGSEDASFSVLFGRLAFLVSFSYSFLYPRTNLSLIHLFSSTK